MLIGLDASRALRSHITGTERYAREILLHLLALPEAANHTWWLYTDAVPGANPFPTRTPGAPADNVVLRVLPADRLWTHRTLAGEVQRTPPDVLFIPAHVVPFALPGGRLPPTVVTVHDLGYHAVPAAHPRRQRLALEWSTRWSVRAATRIIAVSQATAADLERLYGVNRAKIDVIYEATVPPMPVPAVRVGAIPGRYGIERPYLLFVGTLQPRKNVVRLAEAYARLPAAQDVPFDLVLAGAAGWLSEPLIEQIDALNQQASVAGRIHRLGYIPKDDLEALLQGAHGFCFPSLYEGFGLPVLEAQARGVPVMTANNSSLPEVAGDAAILVDPTDVDAIAAAMLALSQDEALRQRLIAAGHENVKRFSWTKAARETMAVLLSTAAQGRK